MTNKELLREKFKESGVTITFLAKKLGCSRNRVYKILDGAECSAREIVIISHVLHLTMSERDEIFLLENVI